MKEKIKTFFSVMILVTMLPFLLTWVIQGKTIFDEKVICDDENEEELIETLAMEIAPDQEKETIKAQAVIARTNLYIDKSSQSEKPERMTIDQMMANWGENFAENYEILKSCVEETEGALVTWNKEPVFVPYHAVSAGETRDASESFGQNDKEYLKSVKSPTDINSENFLAVIFLEKSEFYEKCKSAMPELVSDEETLLSKIKILSRDKTGYAIQVQIEDSIISGEDFRKMFDLNSSCFSLEEESGKIRIVTKGLGHGLGFSQFGANEMAKQGKSYKELLQYYFTGVEIEE